MILIPTTGQMPVDEDGTFGLKLAPLHSTGSPSTRPASCAGPS